MVRCVELKDFHLEILGIGNSASTFADEADGDIAGFQTRGGNRVRGIVADARAMRLLYA